MNRFKSFSLSLLLLIGFSSWVNIQQSENKRIVPKVQQISDSSITKKIIGEWTVVETKRTYKINDSIVEGSSKKCYSCPTAAFFTDKTANVTTATGEIEKLKWDIKEDILSIRNVQLTSTNLIFPDNDYQMLWNIEDGHLGLVIKQMKFTNIESTGAFVESYKLVGK